MTNKLKKGCPKPKTNKLLLLLILAFLAETFYIGYIKEKSEHRYNQLIQLKSLHIVYQNISHVFENKNNSQSFDKIVEHTKQFNTILDTLDPLSKQEDISHDNKYSTLFQNLRSDAKSSIEYVERYKSWYSLITNSTRLIYDMHSDIHLLITASPFNVEKEKMIHTLDEITHHLALNIHNTQTGAKDLQNQMQTLKTLSSSDVKLTKGIKHLNKHINILLEGNEITKALKDENEKLNISNSIDAVHQHLLNEFKDDDRNNNINIYLLTFFNLLLLGFLLLNSKKESKLNHQVCVLNHELEDHVTSLLTVNKEMSELLEKLDKYVISSTTDTKGIITYVSEAFCKISGYTKDELLGQPHNIVRHPDMSKQVYQEMWKTIKAGKEWRGEIKNSAKDGSYYWVDVTVSPELNTDGSILGYSAVRHDITSKKALEVLSQSLEEQVRFRTQELEEMVKKVELLSITDELTKLYNRRYYSQIFETEVRQAKRNKQYFNYLLLDIDNFKLYNDFYGHQLGDKVLQDVAKAFTSVLHRPNDFVFRVGGEEFVIIFTSSNKELALGFSKKIINCISALNIEHQKNEPSKILTISGGLVSYAPNDESMTEEKIYKVADDLLYLAKNEGRNRVKT